MGWWFAPRRWLDFSGRASRRELLGYWLVCFGGIYLLPMLVIASFDAGPQTSTVETASGTGFSPFDFFILGFGLLYFALQIASLIALVAVQVRRLHDSEKSGWNIFWGLIPLIGGLIVLVLLFVPGDEFENLYGPDPRNPRGPDLDALEQIF